MLRRTAVNRRDFSRSMLSVVVASCLRLLPCIPLAKMSRKRPRDDGPCLGVACGRLCCIKPPQPYSDDDDDDDDADNAPQPLLSAPGPSSQPGPFIIDTDCGLDDLATLALAATAAAPLQLVTTVNGLAPPGHGRLLARRLLDYIELSSVPVVTGAEQPRSHRQKANWELQYPQRAAEALSRLGVERVTAEQAARAAPRNAAAAAAAAAHAIVDTARAGGGNTTVLALGALTNLAVAVKDPDFARCVARIIFVGDTVAKRPYNVQCDPAALRAVLASGIELVLVGVKCYPKPSFAESIFERCQVESEDGGKAARALR
eukprot:885178-Prymnesium_polylepis.1